VSLSSGKGCIAVRMVSPWSAVVRSAKFACLMAKYAGFGVHRHAAARMRLAFSIRLVETPFVIFQRVQTSSNHFEQDSWPTDMLS
jgi:hypothetical protein